MWRNLVTMVLLAAFAQAQTGLVAVSQPEPTLMDPTAPATHWIEAIPEYSSLRRGSEEKIMLVVKLNPTSEATTYWGAPDTLNSSAIATDLIIEPVEGLTVRKIEYPRAKRVTGWDGTEMRLLGPDAIDMHFRLRASPAAKLGDRLLKGRLRFQRVGKVGASTPQELQFTIPVRLQDQAAKVSKNPNYPLEITPWGWAGLIALMPILIPISLFTWDGC